MRRIMPSALALLLLAANAQAQRPAVETLTDLELWKADSGSRLLARNQGHPMGTARLHGWMSVRPAASFELRAIVELEGTTGKDAELDAEVKAARVSQSEPPATRSDGDVLEFDPVPKRRRVFGGMLGLG